MSEYSNNRHLLAGAFPHLFPLGFVAAEEGLLADAVVAHMLQQFTNVFASDDQLLFLLFNQKQRRMAAQAVGARVRSHPEAWADFNERARDPAFVAEVHNAARPILPTDTEEQRDAKLRAQREVLRTVRPFLQLSGAKVPFTPLATSANLAQAYAIVQTHGPFNVFFTVSLDDVYSTLRLRCFQPVTNNDAFPAQPGQLLGALQQRLPEVHGVNITHAGLLATAARGAVASAIAFKQVIDGIKQYLLRVPADSTRKSVPLEARAPGVFGHVRAYFGCIETQGRGGLHMHLALCALAPPHVMTLAASMAEVRDAVVRMLDSVFCASVPDAMHMYETGRRVAGDNVPALGGPRAALLPRITPDTTLTDIELQAYYTVLACNMHVHGPSCRQSGRGAWECRFTMPRALSFATMFWGLSQAAGALVEAEPLQHVDLPEPSEADPVPPPTRDVVVLEVARPPVRTDTAILQATQALLPAPPAQPPLLQLSLTSVPLTPPDDAPHAAAPAAAALAEQPSPGTAARPGAASASDTVPPAPGTLLRNMLDEVGMLLAANRPLPQEYEEWLQRLRRRNGYVSEFN
ncbi:MAG: hypothetical protein EOO41_02775, partial [Methanobacteriota archaeon]